MKINYKDGGKLECNKIIVIDNQLLVDDIYNVEISEISEIEEN